MGLLDRIIGRTALPDAYRPFGDRAEFEVTLYEGNRTLEVVGESRHLDNLWRIVGDEYQRGDRVEYETVAVLVPEPENPVDPDAIRVFVKGLHVGYLSSDDAAVYLPGLERLIAASDSGFVALNATIAGRGGDDSGLLGVFLRHDPTDFGVNPSGGVRTGFSEAAATDFEDDSYDLSWTHYLSGNDATDIKQLRKLLTTTREPIERHYMMAALEDCLYRSRDAFASALEEYDAVCEQHDDEMATIRPALLKKFSGIPLMETYRQEAIRYKKAHDWTNMIRWAEHGIRVYGDEALRPADVEDLRERLDYANKKLQAAATKPPVRPSASASTAVVGIETLTCTLCGETFERPRTRGRKPHLCPNCRSTG